MSTEKVIKTAERNCILGRISRIFYRGQKRVPSSVPPVSLFLIRRDKHAEFFRPEVSDYISSLPLLGWKVLLKVLPPQIECEGIGYHLHFEEKQLIWQMHLQLQVEYVERVTVSSQRIDLSTQLVDENFLCSLMEQAYV